LRLLPRARPPYCLLRHNLLLTCCYGNRCKQTPYCLQYARHNILATEQKTAENLRKRETRRKKIQQKLIAQSAQALKDRRRDAEGEVNYLLAAWSRALFETQ
jgi:hypothetical protein